MSDITPADALRELGDDQAEYAAAAAKKLGLPESVEYVEMRTEYATRYKVRGGSDWWYDAFRTRERAEKSAEDLRSEPLLTDVQLVVHEVITTAWREVRSDD